MKESDSKTMRSPSTSPSSLAGNELKSGCVQGHEKTPRKQKEHSTHKYKYKATNKAQKNKCMVSCFSY